MYLKNLKHSLYETLNSTLPGRHAAIASEGCKGTRVGPKLPAKATVLRQRVSGFGYERFGSRYIVCAVSKQFAVLTSFGAVAGNQFSRDVDLADRHSSVKPCFSTDD